MKVKTPDGVKDFRTVWMEQGKVKMINQPLLPHKFEIKEYQDYQKVAEAIKTMVVRGAGAIGAAAGFGMALAALAGVDLQEAKKVLDSTRPTAQNLFYATARVLKAGPDKAVKEAQAIADEDANACKNIGEFGAELIKDGAKILTHCNAGWLAFVDWGSALSPIYTAARKGKKVFVFADETRPRCQGARLTAWELSQEGIPHAIIADNAAGYYMQKGEIDLVITGADRILAGDHKNKGLTANKIGTYEKAVLARENGIPFYIAAPISTFDFKSEEIPIEERGEEEVLKMFGWSEGRFTSVSIAPEGSRARNPAFDVTSADMITAFITERGILKPEEIKDLK